MKQLFFFTIFVLTMVQPVSPIFAQNIDKEVGTTSEESGSSEKNASEGRETTMQNVFQSYTSLMRGFHEIRKIDFAPIRGQEAQAAAGLEAFVIGEEARLKELGVPRKKQNAYFKRLSKMELAMGLRQEGFWEKLWGNVKEFVGLDGSDLVYEDPDAKELKLPENPGQFKFQNDPVKIKRLKNTNIHIYPGQSLALGMDGRVYVSWIGGYSFTGGTGQLHIFLRERTAAGIWNAAEELTDDWSGDVMLVTDGNDPVVFYSASYQFFGEKRTGATWSNPIPLTNPRIPKAVLDAFPADAGKLSSIVVSDPGDADSYLWLPAIRTRADLDAALTSNDFMHATDILDAWQDHAYGNFSISKQTFALGSNMYDLFYRHAEAPPTGERSLYMLNATVNFSTGAVTFGKEATRIGGYEQGEDTVDYDVVPDATGLYHVASIKQKGATTKAYHMLVDSTGTSYLTPVSSDIMSVGVSDVLASTLGNVASVYFIGPANGADAQTLNAVGDFGISIDERIRLTDPLLGATVSGSSATFSWTPSDSCTSYDVLFGTDPEELSVVEAGTTQTTFTMNQLPPDQTHYWKVQGNCGGTIVFSSPSFFTTEADAGEDTWKYYGVVEDWDDNPLEGALLTLFPDGVSVLTNANGEFEFDGLVDGSYILKTVATGYVAIPDVDVHIQGGDLQQYIGGVMPVDTTVYDDGEQGITNWRVLDNKPTGATITNVYEDAVRGNVIEFSGTGTKNSYALENDTHTPWGDTDHTHLRLDINFATDFLSYVQVDTTVGPKYLTYVSEYDPNQDTIGGTYIYLDASSFMDENWHSLERDLQADLETDFPDATITAVNSISFRGNGKIDVVALLGEAQSLGTSISGTILDHVGQPIAGATVYVDELAETVLTDASGSYSFDHVEDGTYTVIATPNGYFPMSEQTQQVVTISGADVDVPFSFYPTSAKVFYDGTNAAGNWIITDNKPTGATIEELVDDIVHGTAARFFGKKMSNEFTLNTDGNAFDYIRWDMKADEDFTIYLWARTDTDELKLLVFTSKYNSVFATNPTYVYMGDFSHYKDGNWHIFYIERGMLNNGFFIDNIEKITVRGNLSMDNVVITSSDGQLPQSSVTYE